jgi:hypothetical protein
MEKLHFFYLERNTIVGKPVMKLYKSSQKSLSNYFFFFSAFRVEPLRRKFGEKSKWFKKNNYFIRKIKNLEGSIWRRLASST